jgi:glycosyltransferase involved in cell wall biosynthesis
MRILLTRNGPYPARAYSTLDGGLPSSCLMDGLMKGLAELGHDVYYNVNCEHVALPEGVRRTSNDNVRVEITHRQVHLDQSISHYPQPCVKTCHTDVAIRGKDRGLAEPNWIFVSRTLAESYGSSRYVLNGIDPAEFIFSEAKDDYFLFVAALDRAQEKGLHVAARVAARTGIKLLVLGSATSQARHAEASTMCNGANAELLGEVRGTRKAELFAGAKALFFPTQLNESFGLVMAEALMSGTPVICSNRGACPEIISPDVGFICETEQEYLSAVANIHRISPAVCRNKAMREFHYLRMANDYVEQYKYEIKRIEGLRISGAIAH